MNDAVRNTHTFELIPAPGNPRNSEGAFLELKDGRILYVYAAFRGDAARDFTAADLAKITSCDGGLTWSTPEVFVTAAEYGAMNVMSVSLLRMANGDLGLIYLIRRSWSDMRIVIRRSSDEGETFGEEVYCSPRVGYFVINNDRALRLSSGRIVIPAAEHVPTFDGGERPHMSAAATTVFYSDDDGCTWKEAATQLTLSGIRSAAGLQEPGLVELAGGLLYGWARTDLGVQYEFLSRDGGMHMTPVVPSGFTSPLSPLSMKRLPDGRLMAIWNPVPEYQTRHSDRRTGGRTPLVYAFSEDEALTWSEPEILEDDPLGGYCYTAMYVTKEALLLSYCAGDTRRDASCLNRTRIRVIPLSSLGDETENAARINEMGIGF